jgi:hypothetical protein
MGFSIFKPFTNEAQVNRPMYSFPMTTNHEMAHQMDLRVKPNVILLDFSSIKMIIYTFNIQGTAMFTILPRILQGTDEKSFDQILKTVHPEY